MSKLAVLRELQAELEALERRKQALEQDESTQREIEFEQMLNNLLQEYGVSKGQAARILCPELFQGDQAAAPKPRRQRTAKTYRNPHTGEELVTKGGNHTTLKAWRAEYGVEAVSGWVVLP